MLHLVLTALFTMPPADLLTVAESSNFECTMTSAEVVDFVARVAESDARATLTEFGRTNEDRTMPLLVVADPHIDSRSDVGERLVVLVIGNIHSGEVCGKEASLMLVRDLLRTDDARLRDIVLLVAPNYNPDGNDRMAPGNRPGQHGPACGMGERPNAQGLDLNRDWMKLESPEARAIVGVLTEWDPHLTIDTHTTNGSQHRYAMTYAHPQNPSGFEPSIEFVRDEFLPTVTTRMLEATGYDSFFYGNFDRAHETWSTYSSQPRYGGPYRGLRGQMSILSEAYAYISYEDRVKVTYAFLDEILRFAHEHRARMRELHDTARSETTARGADPQPDDVVGIRHRLVALNRPVTVKGFELAEDERGRLRPSDKPHDHRVVHRGAFVPTVSVRRPYAYLIDPGHDAVVARLRDHGIRVEPFSGTASVETYAIDDVTFAERPFQGHRNVTVNVTARERGYESPAGSTLVRLAQPLGTLAVYLLEPQSDDGLVTWNFFDDGLEPGADFPVHRVRHKDDLSH